MQRELFARMGICLLLLSAVAFSQKPPSSGVDVGAMDRTVNPCQDFYKFACGNWMQENPIPAQYAVWGRFQELADRNQEVLHQILEDSAQHQDRSPIDQKIGSFYGSCMDEAGAEKKGDEPVMPEIERIRAMKDKSDLAAEIAQLHRLGVPVLFAFGPEPGPDKSTIEIADADQGGLGLPDKSYYLEAKDEQRRKKYAEHVSKMFQLLGDSAPVADAKANAILKLETALAKGSLDRVSRRDPHLTHHSMSVAEFEALIPTFNFKQYLAERHAPEFTSMNVSVPDFFKALNAAIESTTLDDLKSYVIWHEVSHYAPLLSKPFVDLNFEFYGRYLTGAQELQPRWKRCAQLTDRNLGEALGQKYVEKAFAGESKEK